MKYTIYHSPNFGQYDGDHDQIVVPSTAVGTMEIPAGFQDASRSTILDYVYSHSQHVLDGRPWYGTTDEDVRLFIRSTSIGDLIADDKGNMFVVERVGFRKFRSSFQGEVGDRCRCCRRPNQVGELARWRQWGRGC